jgi:hypothetical protein
LSDKGQPFQGSIFVVCFCSLPHYCLSFETADFCVAVVFSFFLFFHFFSEACSLFKTFWVSQVGKPCPFLQTPTPSNPGTQKGRRVLQSIRKK